MDAHLAGKKILVTGGASFIGSHLVDKLVAIGADVTVVDDLSSGRLANLSASPAAKVERLDIQHCDQSQLREAFRGSEIVYHLAAVHGGRGYIDSHPADVCSNFAIDNRVFETCRLEDVSSVVFASSACAYPPGLQGDPRQEYRLKETDAQLGNLTLPLSADLEYGWAKLMGEVQLLAFVRQYGVSGASLRFVTAYGERENESHAIIALIYKAHERMDPFEIWGNGEQSRDFTYVSDIVDGCVLAGEKIRDGRAINLGTGVRYSLNDVAKLILTIMDFHPTLRHDLSKPTGVVNRALDISEASRVLGWSPRVSLEDGLRRTIRWYEKTHPRLGSVDNRLLVERAP